MLSVCLLLPLQPSPPAANAAAMPLSSLKDMAAEALSSTDQFGVITKSDSQEHLIRRECVSVLYIPGLMLQSLVTPMCPALLDPSVAAPGMRLDGTVSGVSAVGSSSTGIPQMQPLLGVAPLGPIPLGQDRVYQLRMLEMAYKHLPQPSDSERVRYSFNSIEALWVKVMLISVWDHVCCGFWLQENVVGVVYNCENDLHK